MNVSPMLPFARLGLIDDPTPRDGALNMAIDETLLAGLGGDPLLRIYRWARPTVSVGYFDAVGPVEEQWPGHEIVRRWTGGGVVEHGRDLTFSLLVPRVQSLAKLPAVESYRCIHLAVAVALERSGVPTPVLQDAGPESPAASSKACFKNPVTHDLMAAGQKIAGGAQRRTRHGLLHQGSVQGFVGHQAGWADALAQTLPGAFGVAIDRLSLSPAQLADVESLAAAKYGARAWLQRF